MGLFSIITPPSLPNPPPGPEGAYIAQLNNILRMFFKGITSTQAINISNLNMDINTLPTQTSLATLRSGDVYRDASAGNVLKVKP
jgi:hypothetical protein